VQAVDTSVPSLARAYDYLLGGRANFAADRALARQWRELYPRAGHLLQLSRTYVTNCCARLPPGEVRQFIDVGSGLPTAPSLHEAVPGGPARVVYVDRDPGVVAHARALVPSRSVTVMAGDLLEPEALLWALRPVVDLAQPACLVLGLVIQALPDLGTARAVVDVLVRALAPGSHVIITAGAGDEGRLPDAVGGAPVSAADVAAFLAGLDLIPPGVQEGLVVCATGRKPASGGCR
jgi:SAM-dependent methyltransferase